MTPPQSATVACAALKTIVFDAVGTLIYPAVPVKQTYREHANRFGITLAPEQISQRFSAAYQSHGRKRYAAWRVAEGTATVDYESIEQQRWRSIVADVFPELHPIEPLFSSLWKHYADPLNWRVYDDVEPTWNALRSRGLQIVIASNFDQRLLALQRHCRILSTCDRLFISSQLGFVKPQPDFYRALRDALGSQPGELLMVGDDWENDYLAPQRDGWHAIPLCRRRGDLAPPALTSLDGLAAALTGG